MTVTSVATVYANLKVIIQASLGVSYSELLHVYDIPKNSFEQAVQRWGLIIEGSPSIEGNTRELTKNLSFSVLLTDEYITSEESDSSLRDKVISMFDKMEQVFIDIEKAKAGGTMVSGITSYSIDRAAIIEGTRIIELLGSFSVRVKNRF